MEGLTAKLMFHSFIIWFGSSFLFGWNMGVLNQPSLLIQQFYRDVYAARYGKEVGDFTITVLWSVTNAVFYPAGMLGVLLSDKTAERYGRKKAILISHIPSCIGTVVQTICVATKLPELLIVGRIIQGVGCGLVSTLAPMYLTEIAPCRLRGAFGSGHQLFIAIGIFFASVFGLREIFGTKGLWPYLLLLNVVPITTSLLALPFLPDSPRFLMLSRHDVGSAIKALQFLRNSEDVSEDLNDLKKESKDKSDDTKTITLGKLVMSPHLRMPLIVACALQATQQFTGINGILFYSVGVFKAAGVKETSVQYAVLGANGTLAVMCVFGVLLIERAGRRPLLIYPLIFCALDLAVLTVALHYQAQYWWLNYVSVVCVLTFLAAFALGLGPIPLIIGAELFRQEARPIAMATAGLTSWIFMTVVVFSFELIQKALKEFTMLIFIACCIASVLFIYFKVPETKHRTFEEIAQIFHVMTAGEAEAKEHDSDVADDNKRTDEEHICLT